MKTINHNLLFQILTFGILTICLDGYSQSKSDITLPENKKVPVIELKGNGYERGLQHGKQLKSEIAEVLDKWKKVIVSQTFKNADTVISEFLRTTNFKPAITRWTPELMDEVKGIADGSGQTFDDIFTFQVIDEWLVYFDSLKNVIFNHCTGIGVSKTKSHPAYIAQNMDLFNYMNGYQILLHISASRTEPEQYILTCAGSIVTTGMNAKGIGACNNALLDLQSSKSGLPVVFVMRGILSKQNKKSALTFIKSVKHATGQNYIIGIKDSVYDFEASASHVVRFYPRKEQSGIVYHTNHAFINHDIKPYYAEYFRKASAGESRNIFIAFGFKDSEMRYEALIKKLDKPIEEISSDVIKATLRSKDNAFAPICRPYIEDNGPFGVLTFSSVLYTLTGNRSVQVTNGPPDKTDYQEHFFNK